MYTLVGRWRESGLAKSKFCKEHQISLHRFNYWLYYISVQSKLPKSPLGKAYDYCLNRWDSLMAYLKDGNLHIDDNLVENAIRPLALGRKNYLFAGSH